MTLSSELMDTKELAELLGLNEMTLYNWRREGKGPPYIRVGRRIRYKRADVDEWLQKERVG